MRLAEVGGSRGLLAVGMGLDRATPAEMTGILGRGRGICWFLGGVDVRTDALWPGVVLVHCHQSFLPSFLQWIMWQEERPGRSS